LSDHFNIDHGRSSRTGFQEIVYGASKTVDQITDIVNDFQKRNHNVLVTKVQQDKAKILSEIFPDNFYDDVSNIFMVGK